MLKIAKPTRLVDRRQRKIAARRFRYGKKETHELLIFRSCKHMYVAILSLADMRTVFSVSSLKKQQESKSSSVLAREIGEEVADRCSALQIKPVVNIAEYRFHGVVKALIDTFNDNMKR